MSRKWTLSALRIYVEARLTEARCETPSTTFRVPSKSLPTNGATPTESRVPSTHKLSGRSRGLLQGTCARHTRRRLQIALQQCQRGDGMSSASIQDLPGMASARLSWLALAWIGALINRF